MTTYFYIDRELSEINYYEERNAYYQQAREKYNKGEEVTFLPIGEKAIPDLLYILNDNRDDAQFNAFFVRNTIMETFKSGNMQAASNLITYLGQETQSRSSYQNPHREMIESVVDEQIRKAPEWLSQLEPKAKFTIADIFAENNPYRLNNPSFWNFDDVKDADKYIVGNTAKTFLNHAIKNKNLAQIPWALKAKALELAAQTENDVPFMEVYKDLLNNVGDANREEKVEKLSLIAQKAAPLFQYENKDMPQNWADMVPACEGAQKLFYNMMYYMKAPEQARLATNSWNASAYNEAIKELGAQRIVDDVVRYKRGIRNDELDVLVQYRPQFLMAKKDLSADNKIALLKNSNFKASEPKRLQMMNEVLNEKKDIPAWNPASLKKEDINFFLSEAEKMRTVSPDMQKFIQNLEPIVAKDAELYKKNKETIANGIAAQAKLDSARNKYNLLNDAQGAVNSIFGTMNSVLQNKSETKDAFTSDSLKQLLFNALDGKEPHHLEYKKQGKISQLFTNAHEKERQQKLEAAITEFNKAINQAVSHKDVFEQLKDSFSNKQYVELVNKAYEDMGVAQKEAQPYFNLSAEKHQVASFEQLNLGGRLNTLKTNFETRRNNLQAKAREALSFTYKGQEFGGKSVLADHEKFTKKIYKEHADSLRSKIKSAARQEMEDRGVFEKPDIENPNQTGKPMSKESTSKVTQMMRDKKLYDKLAKE